MIEAQLKRMSVEDATSAQRKGGLAICDQLGGMYLAIPCGSLLGNSDRANSLAPFHVST